MAKKGVINKSTQSKSKLSFLPDANINGGLILGSLKDVSIEKSESKETANWIFAGKEVPRLVFSFETYQTDKTIPVRHYTFTVNPIDENNTKYPDMEYDKMTSRIHHIFEAYATWPEDADLGLDIPEEMDVDNADDVL